MRLTDDDRLALERRYRTPEAVARGAVTCEALAATCADRGQVLGYVYWRGCAEHLRGLARRRAGARGAVG